MPYEANLVSFSLKTIFSEGCHNVGAFNSETNDTQAFILMKGYALNACKAAVINPNDNQVISGLIGTPGNLYYSKEHQQNIGTLRNPMEP